MVEELRSGQMLLPDFLAQVEARFLQQEPSIQACLPDEKRFDRLYDEAEALVLGYPGLIKRPLLFGALIGVKDIFHVEGFPTQAGSRLPADVFQGKEALSVSRLLDAGALFFGKTVTTEFAYFRLGPRATRTMPNIHPGVPAVDRQRRWQQASVILHWGLRRSVQLSVPPPFVEWLV